MKYALLISLAAAALIASDATGTWTGTLTPAGGAAGPAHLVLKQDGDKLTGTAGPTDGDQLPLRNGKADNGALTFELADSDWVMKFSLKIDGDEVTGDVTRERAGQTQTATLAVKRAR